DGRGRGRRGGRRAQGGGGLRPVNTEHVVIVANGDTTIGAGHVARQLALAQTLVDSGVDVSWRTTSLSDDLRARIARERVPVAKCSREDLFLVDHALVVVDDYETTAADVAGL